MCQELAFLHHHNDAGAPPNRWYSEFADQSVLGGSVTGEPGTRDGKVPQ